MTTSRTARLAAGRYAVPVVLLACACLCASACSDGLSQPDSPAPEDPGPQPDDEDGPVLADPQETDLPLSFSSPRDGEEVSGTVWLRVEAADALAGVEFHAGGRRFDVDLVPPYETQLDTTVLPEGPLHLEAWARDQDGAVASTDVDVQVENTGPRLLVSSPADGDTLFVEDGPLALDLAALDGAGVAHVALDVEGSQLWSRVFDAPSAGVVAAEIAYEDIFPEGVRDSREVTVTIRATDGRGHESETTLTLKVRPRLKWRFDTLGELDRAPALGPDGNLWLGSRDRHVFALRPDGTRVCTVEAPAEVITTPTFTPDGDRLVYGTTRWLAAANAADCSNAWQYGTENVWFASPAVDRMPDGAVTVYAADYDGTLHALDVGGGVRWTLSLGEQPIESTPLVDPLDHTIFVGSFAGNLHAIGADGSERCALPTGGEVAASPRLYDGVVYFGSYDKHFYAMHAADCSPAWEFPYRTDSRIKAAAAFGSDGTAYVGSMDSHLYALDTGDPDTPRWRYWTMGITYGSPVVGPDGTVYIGDVGGTLHAVDPRTGEARWTFETRGAITADVVVVGGTVYVASTDRSLYALHTSVEAALEEEGGEPEAVEAPDPDEAPEG